MNEIRKKSGVLVFDYDGVLANTEPLHWESWKRILAPFRIELTWEQYCRHCRGVAEDRMREVFVKIFPQANGLPDLRPYLAARKLEVRESSMVRSPIPQRTSEMLRRLSDWRLGLVTSAERGDVEPVLREANIQDCFEGFVFRGDVTRHKPAPDSYLAIADRISITTGSYSKIPMPGSRARPLRVSMLSVSLILKACPRFSPKLLGLQAKESYKNLLTSNSVIDYRLLRIRELTFAYRGTERYERLF